MRLFNGNIRFYRLNLQNRVRMSTSTFLWHDYETWGIDPALDKPSQFAAIRTDELFNEVATPAMFYCQPAADTLPHPEACLITGITPQKAYNDGVPEYQFAAKIHALMLQPSTCVVGYNSIRFDDEVTRHTFFRNFYDPYEREWKNGNSRFDIIDVVRLCAALRPEGIQWPLNDEGKTSFRLEHLTAANGIEQEGAHDALVDVRATISLAKLLQEKQPKLWSWALKMRSKTFVASQLKIGELKPVLHVSGMFRSEFFNASLVLPLAMHPTNKNAVICYDLRYDPSEFLQLSVEEIRERIFTRNDELGDKARIALKSIHINKCPMVAPVSMLDDAVAERIQLDLPLSRQYYEQIKQHAGSWKKAQQVFNEPREPVKCDVEKSLYSGGFLSAQDKALCSQVQNSDAYSLAAGITFEDARLNELLFRYRARNFPETLDEAEVWRWRDFCMQRFSGEDELVSNSLPKLQLRIQQLAAEHEQDEKKLVILRALWAWCEKLTQ